MDTGNEKCAQCPFVMSQETQIERLQKISQEISAGAASGSIIEDLTAEMVAELSLSESDADTLSRLLRMSTAEGLNKIDALIDAVRAGVRTLTAECDAPLKLRTTKKGVTYLATLCTSEHVADPRHSAEHFIDDEEYLKATHTLHPSAATVTRTEDYTGD